MRGIQLSILLRLQGTQCVQVDTMQTKIVYHTKWDGYLHPMAMHPGKVTHCTNKVAYNM